MNLNLTKTWETVVKGKTNKLILEKIPEIEWKNQLKLLGLIRLATVEKIYKRLPSKYRLYSANYNMAKYNMAVDWGLQA